MKHTKPKLSRHDRGRDVDSGWAWVVMVTSFTSLLLASGLPNLTGVFHVYLLEAFGESDSKTAWVGALFSGFACIAGPISSLVINATNCRCSAIIGGLVTFIGFGASAFAPNLNTMFFTYGFLGGFGISLSYVPAMVTIGYYFEKRRAIATGIAVTGVPLGTAIFPAIIHALVQAFGWRGTFAIIGAIALNLCACGLLYIPTRFERIGSNKTDVEIDESSDEDSNECDDDCDLENRIDVHRTQMSIGEDDLMKNNVDNDIDVIRYEKECLMNERNSTEDTVIKMGIMDGHQENGDDINIDCCPGVAQDDDKTYTESGTTNSRTGSWDENDTVKCSIGDSHGIHKICGSEHRTMSLEEMPGRCNKIQFKRRLIACLADFRILNNPAFLFMLLGVFLFSTGKAPVMMYLPGLALKMGSNTAEGTLLATSLGIGNTFVRICAGVAANARNGLDKACLLIGSLCIDGFICLVFRTFSHTAAGRFIFGTLFGFYYGVYPTLVNSITAEMVGVHNLSLAFGLQILSMGVGTIIGPPISAEIMETVDDYEAAFTFAGICFLLGCVSCMASFSWMKRPGAEDKSQLGTITAQHNSNVELKVYRLYRQKRHNMQGTDPEPK